MKRLTDKRLAIPPGQWQEVTHEEARELKEIPVPSMRELYYRLSQIEDILGDDYDLDRLRELVGADRDGRCMVLPCEVGTQVWCIVEVARYGYPDPTFEKQLFLRPFKMEWAGDIGKTKFLTRKAAEAALKAMEQDG